MPEYLKIFIIYFKKNKHRGILEILIGFNENSNGLLKLKKIEI
jgi:hypothetical protein